MTWQAFRGDAPENMTIYSASFPDVSDQWPMKDETAREINAIDRALKADPTLQPPMIEEGEGGDLTLIPQHEYSEQAFRHRPALLAWRTRLVPSALALFAVQNPLEDKLPEGTVMDSASRQWFIHANDAIGVRSRAQVLATLVDKYIHNDIESDWVSLASGAAIPVLEALRAAKLDGQKVHLSLVDEDPVALRWAETMAAPPCLLIHPAAVNQRSKDLYHQRARHLLFGWRQWHRPKEMIQEIFSFHNSFYIYGITDKSGSLASTVLLTRGSTSV
jgi:hypothetical protein